MRSYSSNKCILQQLLKVPLLKDIFEESMAKYLEHHLQVYDKTFLFKVFFSFFMILFTKKSKKLYRREATGRP